MLRSSKIFLVSDDENDEFFIKLTDIIHDYDKIDLTYSRSNIDDLKINLKRDFYIICIDYDTLNTDVNDLVNIIRRYLAALPLIFVASNDKSIFNQSKIPNVSFLDKSIKNEIIQRHLVNIIDVMHYNRTINDISHFREILQLIV